MRMLPGPGSELGGGVHMRVACWLGLPPSAVACACMCVTLLLGLAGGVRARRGSL